MTITQGLLLISMLLLNLRDREDSAIDSIQDVHVVNIFGFVCFLILTLMVRYSHVATWFVCPLTTIISFYYFSFLDYDAENVSRVFTVFLAIAVTYFLVVCFSEVWLISTAVYTPLIAYYMWSMGKTFEGGTENNELIIRAAFGIFIYAIVAYKVEEKGK